MKQQQLDTLRAAFTAYARTFYSEDNIIHENIILKEEHTYRVCDYSHNIAASLNLSDNDLYIAQTIALMHDIGRFRQFSQYKTFRDNLSENHADMGVRIINELDILAEFDPNERNIILNAVALHNRQDIPESLDEQALLHARIIRDADKLDIIPLMIDYYATRQHSPKPSLELSFADTPGYSNEIIDLIMKDISVPNSIRKNYHDLMLSQLSWFSDLNFTWSYRHAMNKQYAQRIIAFLPRDKIIDSLLEHVLNLIATRGR